IDPTVLRNPWPPRIVPLLVSAPRVPTLSTPVPPVASRLPAPSPPVIAPLLAMVETVAELAKARPPDALPEADVPLPPVIFPAVWLFTSLICALAPGGYMPAPPMALPDLADPAPPVITPPLVSIPTSPT